MKSTLKFLILFITLIIVGCSHKKEPTRTENVCLFTGEFSNSSELSSVYLVDKESGLIIDSTKLRSGNFSFQIEIAHPKPFILRNKRNQYDIRDRITIWLEPGNISLKGDFGFIGNSIVSGSISNEEFLEYKNLFKSNEKLIPELFYLGRYKSGRMQFESKVPLDSYEAKCEEFISIIGDFIKSNNDSYISLLALSDLNALLGKYNQSDIEELYNVLSDKLQKTEKGLWIKKALEFPSIPMMGDNFIDIIQVNPKGDTIRLSDYIGNYILIDFWASSCGPCRFENKFLREVNRNYKSDSLVIFSVSGDTRKKNWIQAIENDSMHWINVSDLNGWHNEAFEAYGVFSIPYVVIINKEGIIIGRDYCNPELEQELKKIFDH